MAYVPKNKREKVDSKGRKGLQASNELKKDVSCFVLRLMNALKDESKAFATYAEMSGIAERQACLLAS